MLGFLSTFSTRLRRSAKLKHTPIPDKRPQLPRKGSSWFKTLLFADGVQLPEYTEFISQAVSSFNDVTPSLPVLQLSISTSFPEHMSSAGDSHDTVLFEHYRAGAGSTQSAQAQSALLCLLAGSAARSRRPKSKSHARSPRPVPDSSSTETVKAAPMPTSAPRVPDYMALCPVHEWHTDAQAAALRRAHVYFLLEHPPQGWEADLAFHEFLARWGHLVTAMPPKSQVPRAVVDCCIRGVF